MEQQTQQEIQSLPNLNLSNEQKVIIANHLSDSIRQIIEITFMGPEDKRTEAMMQHAFHNGRRLAFQALLTYDQDLAVQAQAKEGE